METGFRATGPGDVRRLVASLSISHPFGARRGSGAQNLAVARCEPSRDQAE